MGLWVGVGDAMGGGEKEAVSGLVGGREQKTEKGGKRFLSFSFQTATRHSRREK